MLRRLVSILVIGSVLMAGLVFLALRPDTLRGVLPPAAIEALGPLGGGDGSRAGDSPADALLDAADGLVAAGPIAAAAGNVPVFSDDVISGYSTRVSEDQPSEITTIRPILGCLLTPPMDASMVGHVTAGRSDLPLALVTYDDTDLAAAVQGLVDRYRETGEAKVPVAPDLAYQAYDVAVTETRAPVYLVLETGPGNRMWNIHAAPGARIERVILLGGDQAGVANLDPVVPVEVILNDGLAACGITPAYGLNAGNQLYKDIEAGLIPAATGNSRLAEITASAAAYDQWFRDSFGVKANATRAGFDAGTLSVVGPVPGPEDPKASYARISGSDIRTTQDDFFEIKGQLAAGEGFAARVMAIATSFAFGDLASLRQGVDF
ncbi:MAG: hypothetical protein NTW20_17590 [Rhodobacterales bacterium]|nr:hypothetical protein [Rhodobacterales bacterium]